jgi:hypothetical protein
MRKFTFNSSAIFAGFLLMANQAFAGNIYEFSSEKHSASADFELFDSKLTILVTNREDLGSEKASQKDFLSGLSFNTIAALTPLSVSLPEATKTWFGTAKDPGTGWGYGFGGKYNDYNNVITAASTFKGVERSSFPAPAEIKTDLKKTDYSIAPANFSGKVEDDAKLGPVFSNSLFFSFAVDKGFSLDQLGKSIAFQYGTSSEESRFSGLLVEPKNPVDPKDDGKGDGKGDGKEGGSGEGGDGGGEGEGGHCEEGGGGTGPSTVPEPSTLALGALGSIGLAFMSYRRRRNNMV